MKLSIYSIEGPLFEGEVNSVSLPTPAGEITILNHHIPLITLVSRGTIRYRTPGLAEASLSFDGGILEVRPESEVLILAESKKYE